MKGGRLKDKYRERHLFAKLFIPHLCDGTLLHVYGLQSSHSGSANMSRAFLVFLGYCALALGISPLKTESFWLTSFLTQGNPSALMDRLLSLTLWP